MRYHYLDNIRWVTVLLVMFFHVFYHFNTYCMGSGIGGFSDYQPQDAVLYLLYPWLMPLLFAVAGMSSRYALQRKSPREYLRTRTRKLLVPATLGLFVFQWMAGYFGMQTMNFRFHTDMGAGQPWWVMYIMWAVCGGGGLWFIQLLWLFSLMTIPIYQVGSRLKQKARHTLPPWLCALFLLLFGFLLYLTDQAVMDGDYSMQNPAMLYNVYRPLYYLTAYLFGYFFFVREEVQTLLTRLRWFLIPAALVCGIVLTITTFGQDAYSPAYIRSVGNNLYAWLAILAMFATFRTWLNHDVSHINNANYENNENYANYDNNGINGINGNNGNHENYANNENNGNNASLASRLCTFFRDASYGLYILQFFVYMSVGYLLRAYTALPPWAMYVLLFLAMFTLTPALYLLIRRIPILRYCVLGLSKKHTAA
ncbi:MAG: acyltransferase family protein [Paludibacteraceae bacterium]